MPYKMNYDKNEVDIFQGDRRNFLKYAGLLTLLWASPVYALDLLKILENPEDLEKAKKIFKGAGSIVASATDLDYKSEFAIGESLALEGFKRYGLPVKSPHIQKYVNLVGNAVAANSNRPGIRYYFVVVNSELYNAFSCPGGIIFVSSALVKSMNNEAELAGVLSHEVAHVSHKHALKSIKRAKFFEGVGKITAATVKGKHGESFEQMIGGLQTVLFDRGLDKNMEFEADRSGMDIAYRTGYNPHGLLDVLKMLKIRENAAKKKGSWFSTHPPLNDRINRCHANLTTYPDASKLASLNTRFLKYKNLL